MTRDELWQAQLRQWPDSVELTNHEVLQWLKDHPDKAMHVAVSMLCYPNGIFYRCGENRQYMGYRYGLDGGQYMSGFTI